MNAVSTTGVPYQNQGGLCTVHGRFWGVSCPGCTRMASLPTVPVDPTLVRIAAALERIAARLEKEGI